MSNNPKDSLETFVDVWLAHMMMVATSVSIKRRHSVFDAQNFGQNAQKRKTVRQVTQRIFR